MKCTIGLFSDTKICDWVLLSATLGRAHECGSDRCGLQATHDQDEGTTWWWIYWIQRLQSPYSLWTRRKKEWCLSSLASIGYQRRVWIFHGTCIIHTYTYIYLYVYVCVHMQLAAGGPFKKKKYPSANCFTITIIDSYYLSINHMLRQIRGGRDTCGWKKSQTRRHYIPSWALLRGMNNPQIHMKFILIVPYNGNR